MGFSSHQTSRRDVDMQGKYCVPTARFIWALSEFYQYLIPKRDNQTVQTAQKHSNFRVKKCGVWVLKRKYMLKSALVS